MDLFMKYLKSHRRIFLTALGFCFIFVCSFLLYHLPLEALLYPTLLCVGIGLVICAVDFFRVKREHELLQQIRTMTDIMDELFPQADTIQEEDYRQIVRLLHEEHNAYREETDRRYTDMIEYYTVWAHQIKTPIASMRLQMQNEDSTLSRKLTSDLFRVEQYVEMVLTFLRLGSDSTDYVFREYDLDRIVKSSVKKFSHEFINRKLSLIYEPLHTMVITDEKWLSFVIEQVLSNALKYTPAGSITITLESPKTLRIRDTGIGIAPEDLPRIFENGYTGYNGRTDRKASGIGLYFCRRICSKLGHTITAASTLDVGTTIDIDLSQRNIEME